jgi:hypothetical protein
MSTDWDVVRANKLSDDHPPGWPHGVRAISMKGVGLLGIHERTGKLYWDDTNSCATSARLRSSYRQGFFYEGKVTARENGQLV